MIPAPLLVVTDRHGADRPLTETVRAVLDGGASWIWFRDKDLERGARKDLAQRVLNLVRTAGGRMSVGGDAALAAEIGADGVHLGVGQLNAAPTNPPHPEVPAPAGLEGGLQSAPRSLEPSFEAAASRRHLRMRGRGGVPLLVGASTHTLADIRRAAEAGSDYVTLSPIFSSASKPGYGPALGPGALREAAAIGLPVIALGGIAPENAAACREAGAAGVAVMGAIMRVADPAAATRRFVEALGGAT